MKSLRLAIRYTEDTIHPMHALVCESPHVDREVVLHETVRDGVTTMLLYVEGDPEAYEPILAAVPSVDAYHLSRERGDAFYLYVRETLREEESRLAAAFERESVMVVPPVEFRADRTMRLSLVGRAGDLQSVLADLPSPVSVDVLGVGAFPRATGALLTDTQRDALAVARAVGYYDVPRSAGIEAVADERGCAVSTVSEVLRRAEARLVDDALDAGA